MADPTSGCSLGSQWKGMPASAQPSCSGTYFEEDSSSITCSEFLSEKFWDKADGHLPSIKASRYPNIYKNSSSPILAKGCHPLSRNPKISNYWMPSSPRYTILRPRTRPPWIREPQFTRSCFILGAGTHTTQQHGPSILQGHSNGVQLATKETVGYSDGQNSGCSPHHPHAFPGQVVTGPNREASSCSQVTCPNRMPILAKKGVL